MTSPDAPSPDAPTPNTPAKWEGPRPRLFPIMSFPFAFIILLAHAINAGSPFPAVGLVPLFASFILSCYVGSHRHMSKTSTIVVLLIDIVLAAAQLGLLIRSWISLSTNTGCFYATPGEWHICHSVPSWKVMLGTYGTLFIIVDFGLHLYFALPVLFHVALPALFRPFTRLWCDCEHCRSLAWKPVITWVSVEEPEYVPLAGVGDGEDEDTLAGGKDVEDEDTGHASENASKYASEQAEMV